MPDSLAVHVVGLEACRQLRPAPETSPTGRRRNAGIRRLNHKLIRWNQAWLDHPDFEAASASNHDQYEGARAAVTNLVVTLLELKGSPWWEDRWQELLDAYHDHELLDRECLSWEDDLPQVVEAQPIGQELAATPAAITQEMIRSHGAAPLELAEAAVEEAFVLRKLLE
jgi:hypothetical protein